MLPPFGFCLWLLKKKTITFKQAGLCLGGCIVQNDMTLCQTTGQITTGQGSNLHDMQGFKKK